MEKIGNFLNNIYRGVSRIELETSCTVSKNHKPRTNAHLSLWLHLAKLIEFLVIYFDCITVLQKY